MKTLLDYIRMLLLCVGGMLVSCTVLIVMSEQSNGTIAGKQSWIYFSLIWFALSILFVVITLKGKISFSFTLPDGIVAALIVFLLITYPWKLNPAPDKLNIALLLVALWFMFRIVLVTYPYLFSFYFFIYIFTGGIEAIWGVAQLFQWSNNGYMVEKMTGSFYSLEAYSGYLALMLPLSLSTSCYYRNCQKLQWWRATTLLYYTSTVSSALIVIALFLTTNRMAWMAAFISSCWVVWMRLSLSRKIKEKWHLSHTSFVAVAILGVVLLLAVAGSIGLVKNNVIENKLAVWRVTTSIASEKPIAGNGLGSFPNAIWQLNHLPAHAPVPYKEIVEKVTSENPIYASNEYLQIFMEHGIIGLIFYLALLISCFYSGLKNKQWGACGVLLSLSVFSLTSYPLQVPSFLTTLTFFFVVCLVNYQSIVPPRVFYTYAAEPVAKGSDREAKKVFIKNASVIFFTILLTVITYALLYADKHAYSPLKAKNSFYFREREQLPYPRLGHYPEFFCEYAQDLNQTHYYQASNELLEKAVRYCRHPAIYEIFATNLQATGNYQEAEAYLLQTIRKHPGRLRSYYLLAKLYGNPEYYHPEKMEQMANTVLVNNKLIYTTLDNRMEKEMKDLLKEKKRERMRVRE